MAYAPGAVERAMKVQDVIVQAIAGKLTWIQAAEILGCSARIIRRSRLRLQHATTGCSTAGAACRHRSGRRWPSYSGSSRSAAIKSRLQCAASSLASGRAFACRSSVGRRRM